MLPTGTAQKANPAASRFPDVCSSLPLCSHPPPRNPRSSLYWPCGVFRLHIISPSGSLNLPFTSKESASASDSSPTSPGAEPHTLPSKRALCPTGFQNALVQGPPPGKWPPTLPPPSGESASSAKGTIPIPGAPDTC